MAFLRTGKKEVGPRRVFVFHGLGLFFGLIGITWWLSGISVIQVTQYGINCIGIQKVVGLSIGKKINAKMRQKTAYAKKICVFILRKKFFYLFIVKPVFWVFSCEKHPIKTKNLMMIFFVSHRSIKWDLNLMIFFVLLSISKMQLNGFIYLFFF